MPNLRLFAALLGCLLMAVPLSAQKRTHETLTEAQQEQIAEAGVNPDARIGLYTKFLNERAETIKGLTNRHESGRGRRLDTELQEFASLIDELASNLDEYGDRKADLRKSLKHLNEAVASWHDILHNLQSDSAYEIARNDAAEALNDLSDQTKKLTAEQEEYFKLHKKSNGQEREEPE